MPQTQWTIHVQPEAPSKPEWGAPCNGCGVCCLTAPCPLGMVLSGHRQGACNALRWDAATARYQCGALTDSRRVLVAALPPLARSLVPWLATGLRTMAPRWIAAGQGCDCSLLADAVTIRACPTADTPAAPSDQP